MYENLEEIKNAIIGGKHDQIEDLVKKAIDSGTDLEELINDGMVAAMDVVGEKYSRNEIYVPEMLVSAVTMKKGLDLVNPLLQADAKESKGKIIMCTVKGDIHDIGKNLVVMMLQGAGFDVIDLGVDLSAERVVEEVKKARPNVLGMSALLTTTMPEIKTVIELLKDQGIRDSIKIMVGGAPVNQEWADKIGADGYGADAGQAVELARRLVAA
ncbi:MAG TPA: cobalamin-binding protein [Desulfobacteraceae bacterium]|jgi:5-methyltetrahydrofolate--homocysteine methyltransferase|nr:cobalamin-binding protein [Desulfobacteraceae bacterium]